MICVCRDCSALWNNGYDKNSLDNLFCFKCNSRRVISHNEIMILSIAHIDCDAFYASVEKRDNPKLLGKPVIVGGGERGVVAACCYVARISGVRSAMPIFEALKRCPNAIIIRPNIEKYKRVGIQILDMMKNITPIVESVSIDEAYLDLSGTTKLHRGVPAQTLINLVKKIEEEVGITVSIGLSYNKLLAKIGSDLEKPRGFSVIGKEDGVSFLADKPVSMLWGVGNALRKKLENDGITLIGELKFFTERELIKRYGVMGHHLYAFSEGKDERALKSYKKVKTISSEITFRKNLKNIDSLTEELWGLSERVAKRLKEKKLISGALILKLKYSNFKTITRSITLSHPTNLAEEIFQVALALLAKEVGEFSFRLMGIGMKNLYSSEKSFFNLLDSNKTHIRQVEQVIDDVRQKFGDNAISKGRGLFKKIKN